MKITPPLFSGLLSGVVVFLTVYAWGIWRFSLSNFDITFLLIPSAFVIALPFFTGVFFAHSVYAARKTWRGSMKMTPSLWGLLLGTLACSAFYALGVHSVFSSKSSTACLGLLVLPFFALIAGAFFFLVGFLVAYAIKKWRDRQYDHYPDYYD